MFANYKLHGTVDFYSQNFRLKCKYEKSLLTFLINSFYVLLFYKYNQKIKLRHENKIVTNIILFILITFH